MRSELAALSPGDNSTSGRVDKGKRANRVLPAGVLLVLGLALAAWLAPSLLALYHLEAGGRALEAAEAFRVAHGAAVNPALDRAVRHFQRAVNLKPSDAYAHRRLGQAWLLAGNNEQAAESLTRAVTIRPHNLLAQIELGHAWDGLGQTDEAVAAYERGRYGPALTQAVVNYLKLADWRVAASGGYEALSTLRDRVLALDADNLPALLRLASIYEGMSEEGAEFARPIREQMKQVAVASVAVSSDLRQAEYLGQTMGALAEDGTWTREMLLKVVAYQVWQFAEGATGPGVERLIRVLMERWPEDADLRFFLAELHHRRGELDPAAMNYRRVLELDPEYAPAALRLGLVNEMHARASGDKQALERAAQWYTQYNQVAPDDLLGLQRWAEVEEALGRAEAGALKDKLRAQTDDRGLAARLLGVPAEAVDLGENLLENGGLEDWAEGQPTAWKWSDQSSTELYNDAAFAGGGDDLLPFAGRQAARVDGLWLGREGGKDPARAGFGLWDGEERTVGKIPLAAGVPYLLSFYYRTEQAPEGGAAAWVSSQPDVLWAHDKLLPSTGGQWRHFVAVGWNRTDGPARIRVLLRSFRPGQVLFDDVQVRPIKLAEGSEVQAGDTRFLITGQGQ